MSLISLGSSVLTTSTGSVQDIVFVTPSPDLNSYSTASLRPQPSLGNSIEEENIPDQHTHLPAYELSKVLSVDANYPANLVRWGGGGKLYGSEKSRINHVVRS